MYQEHLKVSRICKVMFWLSITSLQLWGLNIPRAAVTRELSFYFEDEAFLRLQAELHSGLPDHPFKVGCSPPGHIQGWKQVTNEAQKHRGVISHYFRHIEVP